MSGAARREERRPSPASSASAPAPRNPGVGQSASRQAGAGRGASADPDDRRAEAITTRKTRRTPQEPVDQSGSSSEGAAGAGPSKRQDRGTSRPAQDSPGPSHMAAPRETTSPPEARAPPQREEVRSASGPYAPQIAIVLRQYRDPQQQRQILQQQLDTLARTRGQHGQDVANNEIVRQLRQVIEELGEVARERERVLGRRHEATRQHQAAVTTASQGNTTTTSNGRSRLGGGGSTAIDDGGSSQAIVSAPASYGPSRSGNPDNRSSSGMAVHSAPDFTGVQRR